VIDLWRRGHHRVFGTGEGGAGDESTGAVAGANVGTAR